MNGSASGPEVAMLVAIENSGLHGPEAHPHDVCEVVSLAAQRRQVGLKMGSGASM